MIDEREIWACANTLIEHHGDDAWFFACQRADTLLAQGEMEGHLTFIKILRRIEALQTLSAPGAVH